MQTKVMSVCQRRWLQKATGDPSNLMGLTLCSCGAPHRRSGCAGGSSAVSRGRVPAVMRDRPVSEGRRQCSTFCIFQRQRPLCSQRTPKLHPAAPQLGASCPSLGRRGGARGAATHPRRVRGALPALAALRAEAFPLKEK